LADTERKKQASKRKDKINIDGEARQKILKRTNKHKRGKEKRYGTDKQYRDYSKMNVRERKRSKA
jgi:hypothetical protein